MDDKFFGIAWGEAVDAEDDVVARYRLLSPDERRAALEYADEKCSDNAACELIDLSKRVYAHHTSAALTEALKLPAFRHVGLDDLRFFEWDRVHSAPSNHWAYPSIPRRFVSLASVVQVMAHKFGLWCRADQRVLVPLDEDFLHDNYYGNKHGLNYCWTFDICPRCWNDAGCKELFCDEERMRAVEALLFRRKVGADIIDVCSFIQRVAWSVHFRHPAPYIASQLGITEHQVKTLRACIKSINPDFAAPPSRTTRKWKAAYDAVRELGILP